MHNYFVNIKLSVLNPIFMLVIISGVVFIIKIRVNINYRLKKRLTLIAFFNINYDVIKQKMFDF